MAPHSVQSDLRSHAYRIFVFLTIELELWRLSSISIPFRGLFIALSEWEIWGFGGIGGIGNWVLPVGEKMKREEEDSLTLLESLALP